MDKCKDCKLWFHDHELIEKVCIRCEEPWKEHPEALPGVNLPNGPPGYIDLLKKVALIPTKYNVVLPFAHDPKNSYIEAKIYEDEGHYWRIEGRTSKFKLASDAVLEVVQTADIRRTQMLNEEFEKEFGNQVGPGEA